MIIYILSILGDWKVEESHLYDHTELHLWDCEIYVIALKSDKDGRGAKISWRSVMFNNSIFVL